MDEFDGLVAVVTGGASGIGAATAKLLADRGARVAIMDRAEVNPAAPHMFVSCDVTNRAAINNGITAIVEAFGGIDIVVNNAGTGAQGDISTNDDEEWRRVFDVNVISVARVSSAALPHLRRSAYAAIVNTCSVAATTGLPNRALYAASKGAVLALTLAMATDHVREGIRINCVTPGTTDTPWVSRLIDAADDPSAAAEALRVRQPLGRLVSAAEVAHAIAYLASPLSGSTTGTALSVDGGMSAIRPS